VWAVPYEMLDMEQFTKADRLRVARTLQTTYQKHRVEFQCKDRAMLRRLSSTVLSIGRPSHNIDFSLTSNDVTH